MNQKVCFSETQRFSQWWLWAILGIIDLGILLGVLQQLFLGQSFGNNPMSNTGLGLMLVFMFLINLLLYNFKLETVITEDGIYVKLFPIHFKFRFIDWNIINKSYTRKYKPLLEFGGWGLRYGFGGTAYNVSGNEGLQLEYNGNSHLLIGTHRAEELKKVLIKLGHWKE